MVESDQEYRTVVHIFSGHAGTNMYPQFTVDTVPGVYRLVWHDVLQTYDPNAQPHGAALPKDQRRSNRFHVDVE